jgi:ABC-2 type transport system ATP-binding protein
MPAFVTTNLGLHYGSNWAVRSLNTELKPGITGLVGPNGSGKTTFMRLIMGLLRPSEGHVDLFGADPFRKAETRLRVGYLPQTFDPPRTARVGDYLQFLTLLAGVDPGKVRRCVQEALETVNLTERRRSPVSSLSGGMLRRLGVAQSIAHSPNLLIADEPGTGLDPEERLRLYRSLRQTADQRPVLVSSHLVDELEWEADHIWFMKRGRLVWTGSVREALNSVAGQVREGALPAGEVPLGVVVSRRDTDNGVSWRVFGEDDRLTPVQPTMRDVYFARVGGGGSAS